MPQYQRVKHLQIDTGVEALSHKYFGLLDIHLVVEGNPGAIG